MPHSRHFTKLCISTFTLAATLTLAGRANAQLSLTPAGTLAGFTLSTFATGFATEGTVGPVGITFTTGGGVLVADYPGNLRLFAADVDNQTVAGKPFTFYGQHNAVGLAAVGSNYYMVQQGAGTVVRVNADTSFGSTVTSGLSVPLGVVTNPVTGHLLASLNGSQKIVDINPINGVTTDVITGLSDVDGISISADGTVVYAAVRGSSKLQGYNIQSHALVFDAGVPNIDGTQVGYGSLSGFIFANLTNGNLLEIRLSDGLQTTIANGGTRGDFVAADPNGSLLVTQTGMVQRLTAPNGGGFSSTPEPGATGLLVASGLSGVGLLLRRLRKHSR